MFEALKRWLSDRSSKRQERKPSAADGERSASGLQPDRPTGPAPGARREARNRHGIRIIDPEADLGGSMAAGEEDAGSADVIPGSGKADPPVRPRRRRRAPAVDRHGIRIIDPEASLEREMAADEPIGNQGSGERAERGGPRRASPGPPAPQRDRHGIPRLDAAADLRRLFQTGLETAVDGSESFAGLLEASLHQETGASILRKKREGAGGPGPPTLKQRLKRYPPPQEVLDLHGFRSHEAASRTRAFVESRRYQGTHTLLIVVGRGLHSEEGPVLPGVVESVLQELKREGAVLAYRWERRSRRKSGAVIVFLERPRGVGRG